MRVQTALPWRTSTGRISLLVRVTPKGGRDTIDGMTSTADGVALKVRVRAAPEDGEANAAVTACIADWLGVAKRDVEVVAGHKSRVKRIAITGDAVAIEQRLREKCAVFAE